MSPDLLLRLALTILLLPLGSFLILVFIGKRLTRQGDWFGTAVLFICLAISLFVLYAKLSFFPEDLQFTFKWLDLGNVPLIGNVTISLGLMVDNLSAIMMVVVCIVSAFVHLFSIGYMHGDVRYSRYFGFLGLFTFSMLMIVLTNNLFTMYVGWELVD